MFESRQQLNEYLVRYHFEWQLQVLQTVLATDAFIPSENQPLVSFPYCPSKAGCNDKKEKWNELLNSTWDNIFVDA